VLGVDSKPLTPTTPAKARKLLKAGLAKKRWSKFGTFGIQLLVDSRKIVEPTSLGSDTGTKFEGYSVIVGKENLLNIKLDLPDKKKIVNKVTERRDLRRARRHRKCRRRPNRSDNRARKDFLAPSQSVIVNSRLKVIRELFRIYPISMVGLEDVRFNHAEKRWGANFSTVEIGKRRLRDYFSEQGASLIEFQGYETEQLRQKYGYKKSKDKRADKFSAHCSDSLALACEVGPEMRIEPGPFLVVDDRYRAVRRRLHDTQPAKGGVRAAYSRGTVFGVAKGRLICAGNGKIGQLCGEYKGAYRYYDKEGKRQSTKRLLWVSTNFLMRGGGASSPA
jgi:hypothetical protein